jgi:hypothetical protein
MEHAKRMVLIDEKLIDNMWRKQDMSWKRPTEQSAKHSLSKDMRLELNDNSIAEDIKVKQYQQMLSRFLNTKRKLLDEPLIDLNVSPSAENDLIGLNIELTKKTKDKKKDKKKIPSFPLRRSKRKVKTPKKILWETW